MTAVADRLTLDDAARVLGARREGRGYRAPCPVHGGDGHNLAIDPAADGSGPVFFCHSHQCDSQDILAAVRARAGAPTTSPASGRAPLGNPVAVYVYRDPTGAPVGEVRRYAPPGEGKTFRQYGPDGTPKAPRALATTPYQLPAVREEIERGRGVVFVVEGEKDVETLRAWGLVATCNSQGAERWAAAHAAHLAGARDVIVLADNDDAGRRHAAAVARSLLTLTEPPDVRVLRLPGLAEKGDVTDWACAGGTRAALLELARGVLPTTVRTVDAVCGLGTAPAEPAPSLTSAERPALPEPVCLLTAPPEPEPVWLVPGQLLRGERGMLIGEGGDGKTTHALYLAGAVAAGGMFCGTQVATPGPVLIVSGEDPRGILQNRLEALARGHGWPLERMLANTHVLALVDCDLADARWRAHLVAIVERLGAVLVILDPLADLASGEENSATERLPVKQAWTDLTRPTNATVLLVHHAAHATPGREKKNRSRGTTAIPNASRQTYYIESTEQGLSVTCTKLSRAEKPAPFVLERRIVSAPGNRAVWQSARFDRMSAQEAALSKAEAFVVDQLQLGARLNTSELKGAAKGTGVSGADIARALRILEGRRLIDFEPGDKGAKLWGLCLPGNLGNQTNEVARQAERLPGNRISAPVCLPAPYRGASRQADSADVGQPDDDAAYLADERAGIAEDRAA